MRCWLLMLIQVAHVRSARRRGEMPNLVTSCIILVECVQLGAVSVCAASARRTALPGCAGYPLVAYSHHRYEARPAETTDRQSIEPEEVFARTNYSRPHTIHCGPEAIYVSALGDPNGDGPRRHFMLDCETFEVSVSGKSTAAINFCITIFGGTSGSTRCSAASGALRT
jgi:56kDa selenium binding protein (SBP56).